MLEAAIDAIHDSEPQLRAHWVVFDSCKETADGIFAMAPTGDQAITWLVASNFLTASFRLAISSILLKASGYLDQGAILDRSLMDAHLHLLVLARAPIEAGLGFLLHVADRETAGRESLAAQFDVGENPFGDEKYRQFLDHLRDQRGWYEDLVRSRGFDPAKLKKKYGKLKQHGLISKEAAPGFCAIGDVLADVAHVRGVQLEPYTGMDESGRIMWRIDPVLTANIAVSSAQTLNVLTFCVLHAGRSVGFQGIEEKSGHLQDLVQRLLRVTAPPVASP